LFIMDRPLKKQVPMENLKPTIANLPFDSRQKSYGNS
jgi:hypothetical protein